MLKTEEKKKERQKKLFAPEKRALNQFIKALANKKQKAMGFKATRMLIAKIYEAKVMADEADDMDHRPRDGFPSFLCDYMLKEYGIKSLAMQNLAKLVKAVAEYSDTAHAHYDERIHVFGKLSGMLDPYDYRAVEVDLIMDYLLELMNRDANSVDENMNSAQPFFDTENATELLSSLFQENNMVSIARALSDRITR